MTRDAANCPQCGRECPADMNFCPACGAKLQAIPGVVGTMIEDYRKRLADTPNDADAHYNLALAYLKVKDEAAAEVHLRRVTELEPEFADAYAALGRILLHRGDMKGAIDELAKALQVEKNSPAVRQLAEEIKAGPAPGG